MSPMCRSQMIEGIEITIQQYKVGFKFHLGFYGFQVLVLSYDSLTLEIELK